MQDITPIPPPWAVPKTKETRSTHRVSEVRPPDRAESSTGAGVAANPSRPEVVRLPTPPLEPHVLAGPQPAFDTSVIEAARRPPAVQGLAEAVSELRAAAEPVPEPTVDQSR